MKILVYENPREHETSPGRARTLYPPVETSIRFEEGESRLAKDLIEADSFLSKEKFDAVIIHHYSFDTLDYLKSRYPNLKFAAISALLERREKCRPGSLQEAMRDQLEEHYDFVLGDYCESIWEMMGEIRTKSAEDTK